MKQTLLEMTQDILFSLTGDEITSISDNYESKQVARIIRRCYYNIVPIANLPEHYSVFQLNDTDANSPTVMTLPQDVQNVEWLKYDKMIDGETDSDFREVQFMDLLSFTEMMHGYKPTDDTSVTAFNYTIDGSSVEYLVRNDCAPNWYTVIADHYVIMDAYDSDVETFLTESKSLGAGKIRKDFTLADSTTPSLDDEQFPLLINEALSTAWNELKQVANLKTEKEARKHWVHLQNSKTSIPSWENHWQKLPNYGRK